MRIEPTVGRKLWFYPGLHSPCYRLRPGDPIDATIVAVQDDGSINVVVFDASGTQHTFAGISLVQYGEPVADGQSHCKWMPYQVGQAAKTEAAAITEERVRQIVTDEIVFAISKDETRKADESSS